MFALRFAGQVKFKVDSQSCLCPQEDLCDPGKSRRRDNINLISYDSQPSWAQHVRHLRRLHRFVEMSSLRWYCIRKQDEEQAGLQPAVLLIINELSKFTELIHHVVFKMADYGGKVPVIVSHSKSRSRHTHYYIATTIQNHKILYSLIWMTKKSITSSHSRIWNQQRCDMFA